MPKPDRLMRKIPIFLCALLLSAAAGYSAEPAEAGLVAATVGAEIQRGMNSMIGGLPPPAIFRQYVTTIIEKSKSSSTDTDGFCFGLYYQAWHFAWAEASNGCKTPADQSLAETNARYYHLMAAATRELLPLTVDQVKAIAGNSYLMHEEKVFGAVVKSGEYRHSMRSAVAVRGVEARKRRRTN
jgi:hypothetical protein